MQINIPDLNILIDLTVPFKLLLSVLIGLIVGRERKRNDKSAGSRTLAIVSLAACLIAILTLKINTLIVPSILNFSRLMAYGIASIGFLGSAVVIHNKKNIDGVTTASLIWAIVPINYCIGLGFYFYGVFSSFLVYLILESKYFRFSKKKGL